MKLFAPSLGLWGAFALALSYTPALAQPMEPMPFDESVAQEGDHVIEDFTFESGETLPELNMHYRTLGTPRTNAAGEIDNAVMILHGTGGTGAQFLGERFADYLYGPGQPLDTSRYFIILPDNIGHGGSSKPSDGLRMDFPEYTYNDMVEAQRRMLVDGLGVNNLRLVFGTSMGCMHIFLWAEQHPDFSEAMMPMACQPVEIAGRNRMWRYASIEAIKADPAWNGGNYQEQPVLGLRTASSLAQIAGTPPWYAQANFSTREAAEEYWDERIAADIASRDANDFIYQFDSSRFYNPEPDLEKITVPMTWINSADDFINPPELAIAEALLDRMPTVRYILIPASAETRGHSTHTYASFWRDELQDLLERTE